MRKSILIPSVKYSEIGSIERFKRHFKELELDLYGLNHGPRRGEPAPPSGAIEKAQESSLIVARSLLDNAGMRPYSVHLRGFDLSGRKDANRDAFLAHCELVHSLLKPEVMVLHAGYGSMASLVSNLEYVSPRMPGGVDLALENLTKSKAVLSSPGKLNEFIDMAKGMPPNIGFCIDTTHPAINGRDIDPESYTDLVLSYMRAAMPLIKHFHFSDRQKRGVKMRKHLPIGDGMVDWGRVKSFLSENGYQGRAAIEIRWSDDMEGDIIKSACSYFSCKERDLKNEEEKHGMPELVKTTKAEALAKIAALPGLGEAPGPLLGMLDMPDEGILEQTEDHIYFVVPSASYDPKHADPYDIMAGEAEDRMGWADYVFGVRYHGKHLSALLIDKDRRIAVEWVVRSVYLEDEDPWAEFQRSLKRAIDEIDLMQKNKPLDERPDFDHLHLSSIMDMQNISKKDPIAWK